MSLPAPRLGLLVLQRRQQGLGSSPEDQANHTSFILSVVVNLGRPRIDAAPMLQPQATTFPVHRPWNCPTIMQSSTTEKPMIDACC